MALEVDLRRVDLNESSLRTSKDDALQMLKTQYNALRYIMDYPTEKDYPVYNTDISRIQQTEAYGISNDLPELRMLETERKMAETQLQMTRHGYIPSLSLAGFLEWNAWTGDLKRWGSGYPDNKFWNSYGLGVTLRIPIFDSLDKRSKTRKGRLDVANAELRMQDAKRDLQVQYDNALNERACALQNYQREKEAYELAREVYALTSDQYTEGEATMTAVLQG
ncbi:MAG: TolC family protein [Prevotellaceae bacterium]|nr:TolC family protein [Prevotellaceae bacterium]